MNSQQLSAETTDLATIPQSITARPSAEVIESEFLSAKEGRFEGATENQPAPRPALAAPAPRDTFDFARDHAPHPEEFPWEAAKAPSGLASAAGIGLGIAGAQAAIGGVEALGEAAKSPAGSIGAFLPGGGGGGGTDYAGASLSRAVLAALNGAGGIPNRF